MYKYHTILINGHDLYKECRLIPTSKPIVSPPEVKTEYVDLPNEDGSLDYTDSLGYWVPDQSLVKYKNRQGSWEFLVNPDEMAWATMYEKLTQIVTGGKTTVILTDDFFHKWEGRVWINDIKTNEHDNRVTLNYILYPYKKVNSKFTRSIQQDWLWNELFDNTIFYGTFSVDSRYGKWRNLYNPTSEVIYPTIDVAISTKNRLIDKSSIKIDLNNGQWVDTGEKINGNTVYMSDLGSYHIPNGVSRARITFGGYSKLVIMIRSYAESSYDYTMAGQMDVANFPRTTATNYVVQHTRSRQSATKYYEARYEPQNEEHFIEIAYAKDSSSDSNADRGYFYIDESQSIRNKYYGRPHGTCTVGGQTYNLYHGKNKYVPLQPGNNIAYFSLPEDSDSMVSISYDIKGEML